MKTFILLQLILHSFIAQAANWVINKDHSDLMFQVEYLGMSKVHGRFKSFEGQVVLNENEIPTDISMSIYSSSIDTGNTLRDSHLKRSDFFNVKQYPVITFSSSNISVLKSDNYKAEGVLSIKGTTEKVIINFSMTNTVTDTWGYINKFVNFTSKIKRSTFNLSWNKTLSGQKFILADEVEFSGNIQIQPVSAKTPTSKFMIPDTNYLRGKEKLVRGDISDEDFNQEFKKNTNDVNETPVNIYAPVKSENNLVINVEQNNKSLWWAAYLFIGFIGFLALIIVSFYIKNKFADYFPENYKENGLIGHLSDFVIILLALLFSAALYILGQCA